MKDFLLREIVGDNLVPELAKIGFDESYRAKAANKYRYKNFKIYPLNPAQANILKQTALSVGADCATHRNVITGKIEESAAILGGSVSELRLISQKLKFQPFSLSKLADKIEELLNADRNRKTKIVGILNVTPDSFSDGGLYTDSDKACRHLVQMIEDGADMIDIGAESTRPQAEDVSVAIQIERLKPVLSFLEKENLKTKVSVDTRSSEVANFVLNMGVHFINDVSGFDYDAKMPEVIGRYGAGVILQHSKGTPKDMQDNPTYDDVIGEIYDSLRDKTELAKSFGIEDIIVDPGIGFGKKREDNFEILDKIEEFYGLNYPVMAGVSRKSFLGVKADDNSLKDSLTLAVSYPLVKSGVDYLRVHNVKLHAELIKLVNYNCPLS